MKRMAIKQQQLLYVLYLLLEVQYLKTQNPLLEMRAEVGEDVVVVARG